MNNEFELAIKDFVRSGGECWPLTTMQTLLASKAI